MQLHTGCLFTFDLCRIDTELCGKTKRFFIDHFKRIARTTMGDDFEIGHFAVGIKLRENKRCLVNDDAVGFALINKDAEA